MDILSFARMAHDLADRARDRHERAGNQAKADFFYDIALDAQIIIGKEVKRLNS